MYIQVIQVILERVEMGDKNGIQFGEVEADTTYFHKKKNPDNSYTKEMH